MAGGDISSGAISRYGSLWIAHRGGEFSIIIEKNPLANGTKHRKNVFFRLLLYKIKIALCTATPGTFH